MENSDSLVQLAKRDQACLFFGLLAVVGVSPEVCIASDASSMPFRLIDTSVLPSLLHGTDSRSIHNSADGPHSRDSLYDTSDNNISENDDVIVPTRRLNEALARAENAMKWEAIPLLREYEEQEQLTLWNSTPFAVLFSVDVLMDTLVDLVRSRDNRSSESLFQKWTAGVANSLLHVGKCDSLAHRLDLKYSDFYHLMSLPNGSSNEDHSRCSQTSCSCFNVNQVIYRTRHTEDCVMCGDIKVLEAELVHLIRKSEVPLLRSTVDSDGSVNLVRSRSRK
jgi:hypothetical protein